MWIECIACDEKQGTKKTTGLSITTINISQIFTVSIQEDTLDFGEFRQEAKYCFCLIYFKNHIRSKLDIFSQKFTNDFRLPESLRPWAKQAGGRSVRGLTSMIRLSFRLICEGNSFSCIKKTHFCLSNFIQRALKIYVGKENFKQEYGYTLSALGSSYRYLGQYAEAEDYLKMGLKIFESVESPSELRVMLYLEVTAIILPLRSSWSLFSASSQYPFHNIITYWAPV